MGQVLHGSARTTEAVRRVIQHSQDHQAYLETNTWATIASVGMPPSIRRAAAGACTTTSSQVRQAYLGRRTTRTEP